MKKTNGIACAVQAVSLLAGVANAAIISEFVADGVNAPGISGYSLVGGAGQSRYHTNETYNGTSYDAWAIYSPKSTSGSYYDSSTDAGEISDMKNNGYTLTYIARTDTAAALGHHSLRWYDAGREYRVYFEQHSTANEVWLDTPGTGSTKIMDMDLSDDYHTFQVTYTPEAAGSYTDADVLEFYMDGVLFYTSSRADANWATSERTSIRVEFGDLSTAAYTGLHHVNTIRLESRETPTIQLGSNRELFVDYYLIDTDATSGVDLVLQTPVDEGKVIAFDDEAWESGFSGYCTVLKDNGLYKLYYRSGGHACYAYSSDGANWIKPGLGLFYVSGTWDNNVIMTNAKAFSPFIDTKPGIPAAERYKAVNPAYYDASGGYLEGFVSSNGVDWARINGANPSNSVLFFPEFSMDSQNVAFYSEAEQQYVCYFRDWVASTRRIRRATASVFSNFTDRGLMEYGYPGPASSVPAEHHYINGTFPYFRAPHTYIALAARFVVDEGGQIGSWAEAQSLGVTSESYYNSNSNHNSYAIFMSTRPGQLAYDRPFTNPYIDASAAVGKQMARSDYPALNAVRTGADEMSFYVIHNYASTSNHLRRYSLRLDGFVALSETNGVAGEMVTKPFTFEGDRLRLNYLARAGGSVKIEIQDANGDAIPGYALADAVALTGDDTDADVSWAGGTDVGALEGQTVKLRFEIDDADLFAFRFIPDDAVPVGYTLVPASNAVKVVIDTSTLSSVEYIPQSTTDLVGGSWAQPPHSDDGVNPFVVTNVEDYATTTGSNAVIYLETDAVAEFFKILVK